MKSTLGIVAALCLVLTCVKTSAAFDTLTEQDIDTLLYLRSQVFGGSSINNALVQNTITGESPPVFAYDSVDRAIISWKLKDANAASFAQAIGLPQWMSLAKVAPILTRNKHHKKKHSKKQRKSYYVLADIANTERYVQGAKVEWKTFVTVGADPVPRILRFDSQNENPGVDLLEVAAQPFGFVEWGVTDGIASGTITNGVHSLEITIPFRTSCKGKHNHKYQQGHGQKRFSREFLTAGEHVYGTTGSHSRYFFNSSLVKTGMRAIKKKEVSVVNTFPWAAFVGEIDSVAMPLETTENLVRPVGMSVEEGSDESQLFATLVGMALGGQAPGIVFQTLMTDPMVNPQLLPTLYYAILDLYQGLSIFSGQELPKMYFELEEEPRTIFINFEIPRENVAAFGEAFLPAHFELAKMRFYPEQKRAVYAVSLNIYKATGQEIGGLRAEWSTYVINPDEDNPVPRFSVLNAQSTNVRLDPVTALENFDPMNPGNIVGLLEPPSDVFEFTLDETDGIQVSIVNVAEDVDMIASIAYPAEEDILRTAPLEDWMVANDFVYWGEAADVLKYDSLLMYPELLVFEADLSDDTISDTAFAGFVDPEPLPIIIWNGPQAVALEPWGNLEDIVVR